MVTLRKKDKHMSLSEADYVLEKFDKFDEILGMLTPKFKGNWNIIMIDPKVTLIEDLVSIKRIPEWINIIIYTSDKKIEMVALQHPDLAPKEVSVKDKFDEIVSHMNTVIATDASKLLLSVYRQQPDEVEDVLARLESDKSVTRITRRDVEQNIAYTKRTYVSDVLLAFIRLDSNRWKLYEKVHAEIGTDILYFAMYKYVKKLLKEKADYLENKDVTQYVVKTIDAATIDYVYILFANSASSKQLISILHAIENRCESMLNLFTQ